MNIDQRRPNPKLLHNTRGKIWSLLYRLESWLEYIKTPESLRIKTFDICKKFPLPDACAKVIFASHLIEHLPYSGDTRDEKNSGVHFFLRECHRVLEPGGVIRLSTPDFDLLFDRLKDRDEKFFKEVLVEEGIPKFERLEESFLRVLYEQSTHAYCFNFEILAELFQKVGFVDIKKSCAGQSRNSDIVKDSMDNRPSESLFIEAEK